jgi:branched-chain amino acid transport system permease protein
MSLVQEASLTPSAPKAASASTKQLIAIPIVMVIFTALVLFLANAYWLTAATAAVALSLSVAGLAILYGQLGLVSLCQFALVGVGGWVTLRVGHHFHWPFEISLLCGGVVASASGMIFGIPALRLRGLYLALTTLMLSGAFQVIISAWGFPDGGEGFLGRASGGARVMLPKPELAQSAQAYFVYVALVATLGYMLVHWHKISKPGRAWALIRKGETVALASGVRILRYKAWAFALSGLLAGIAGGLLAGNVGQLDGRAFTAFESLNLYAIAVVGGVFNWYGALIAGLLLRAVPALLTQLNVDGFVTIGIFGVALFHALATAPSGVAGQISGLVQKLASLFNKGGRP